MIRSGFLNICNAGTSYSFELQFGTQNYYFFLFAGIWQCDQSYNVIHYNINKQSMKKGVLLSSTDDIIMCILYSLAQVNV